MRHGMRERNWIAELAVLAGVIVLVSGYVIGKSAYIEMMNENSDEMRVFDEVIRFHVRANSDGDEDQRLKMNVKSAVVSYVQPLLEESDSVSESRQILNDNIDNIRDVAVLQLQSDGCDDAVSVYMERCYFPAKSYGDVTFPPGEYEAFRIDIGKAQGRNWWCVLYPPLCFVDASYGVLSEDTKQELKNILTEEEYNAITERQCEYRFRWLKVLDALFR